MFSHSQLRKLSALIIICAVFVEAYQLYQAYRPNFLYHDARITYLPLAEALREGGLSFLLDPRSLKVPPIAYFYYIPFVHQPELVKIINGLLGMVSLFFVYQIIRQLGGYWHATLGLAIYVLTPKLSQYWPVVLTEPIFMFFNLVWLWAIIKMSYTNSRYYLVLAVLSLSLATLTRATYIYLIYFLFVFSVLYLLFSTSAHRQLVRNICVMSGATIAILWFYITKNIIAFDFQGIATGIGNALYLGNHPFFGGAVPTFNGNVIDVGSITRKDLHLSVIGDQRLLAVAKTILSERSVIDHILFFAHKLYIILFDYQNPESRYLRLVIVPFFIATLWQKRMFSQSDKSIPLFWLLSLILIYQFAVLVPVLALDRYTVASTSALTAIIGGYVITTIWQNNLRIATGVTSISLLLILVGYWDSQRLIYHWPSVDTAPHEKNPLLSIESLPNQTTDHFRINGNRLTLHGPSTIQIDFPNFKPSKRNTLLITKLNLTNGDCNEPAVFKLRENKRDIHSKKVSLYSGENFIHSGFYPKRGETSLNMTISFRCDNGTQIAFDGITGFTDITSKHYYDKVMSGSD